jgi:hypothetical protein
MPLRIATTAAALAAAAQLLSPSPTLANPMTYDLSATLYGGSTVSGTFTLNGNSMTAYDFSLPASLPDPVSSPLTQTNSYLTLNGLADPSTGYPDYQIETTGTYLTVLNLQIVSLPTDATPVALGFSSLLQALNVVGGSWDYIGTFQSGSITLTGASPVPGPIAGAGIPGIIFAGGGLLGWWRRKRKAEAAV